MAIIVKTKVRSKIYNITRGVYLHSNRVIKEQFDTIIAISTGIKIYSSYIQRDIINISRPTGNNEG